MCEGEGVIVEEERDGGLRVKMDIATELEEGWERQSGNISIKGSAGGSELAAHTITNRAVNGTARAGFMMRVCLLPY
jgi:hypothetical protein